MKRILSAALFFSATFSFAQAPQADDGQETPEVEGSATILPSNSDPEPEVQMQRGRSTHNVSRGDTLWDLSQKYLGSPWYWPKVWSYNPEIANPHWIYPGNQVRFVQSGEDAPTQVEVGAPPAIEALDLSDRVTVTGKLGYVPKNTIALQATGFVTAKEVEEAGRIIGSNGENDFLSYPSDLYIEFASKGRVRVGETFTIFKGMGPVNHPSTDALVGYLTKIVGAARAVAVAPNGVVTMQIVKQFDTIGRGDLIGPSGESLLHQLAPRRNDREIKDGVVVASTTPFLSQFGEHNILVVDKGSEHGVKEGNLFSVIRQHDPSLTESMFSPSTVDTRFPEETVGTCMAFEVKSRATTCLMVASMREAVRGDRLEMRIGGQTRTVRR
jgi:hypothetical protein